MATFLCRVQFLDDTDPFNSTNFPEPTRPPLYTFREDIPLINQIAGVHRLLKAPQKPDDCALQLSHNGSYLDLEATLAEQRDELEGFQEEGGRGKKHSILLRTQLSIRVHACIASADTPGPPPPPVAWLTEPGRCGTPVTRRRTPQ
ncbi:FH1/FH2 domain-containing protein 3-like [Pseudoliparis swirei]|uniref:FH1/FH2 domain-containing protein 3-like n=1 Tax=Pseudoliparis swirei TaxID=2059687 RepID=UPI0024BE3B9E|nr:FH1/FH2 domain-containing protein 3-like [Pseudoliparis swirei]